MPATTVPPQSLACQSRRPHSHPNQHTQEELKLIADMHRRNPKLEIVELWVRLRKRGYTRTIESLWRVMRREGWLAKAEKKKPYKPKPYEQMQYPGQRVQIDVKVVPRRCIADPELKLYQYTAIDEYSRYRVLDTVDNSQINVLSQRTMHRICTAATNEEVSFAYRVAIPRQRFRWRNAFSTRWRSL